MKREFVYMPKFSKEWTRLGLRDSNLAKLEDFLMDNPNAGNVIVGTGGLKKVRWVLPGRGKSGSLRVLYIDFLFDSVIFMIDLFPKDEKENLSHSERNAIKELIKAIGEELKK